MDSPLVIITGAGASVNLGRGGEKLPQMSGWAKHLCDSLPVHKDVLGLRPDMAGDDFEERIGRFLRFARALPHYEPFVQLGLSNPLVDPTDAHVRWYHQATSTCTAIERKLFASLHELFGHDQIDPHAAGEAYRKLLSLMNPQRYSIATTNYDCSVELGLRAIGARAYSGHDANLGERQLEPVHLDDQLLDDLHRHGVLYLHGRVGWYRTPDGGIAAADHRANFNPDNGDPAILLPDPAKSYEDAATSLLWSLFRTQLGQAARVLVVGHSLHDAYLLDALRSVDDSKLAVTVFATDGTGREQWQPGADTLMERIGRKPHIVPMDFGPELAVDRRRLDHFVDGKSPDHSSSSVLQRI